jgi:hypothetical protein
LSGNTSSVDTDGNTNIVGAGGGVSNCTTSTVDANGNVTACSASYAKPSWQSSFGSQTARELPDVSLFAGDGASSSAWLLCASNLGADSSSEDCTTPTNGAITGGTYANFQAVGGTSAASPAFAGMLALVIQQLQQTQGTTNVRLGQADYTLYPLSKQHAAAFHDVTTGNISVFCLSGSTDCGANGFLTGYDAGTGYDLATGLGSVDVTQMVQNWSSISFKPTSTALTLNGSTTPITIVHGTAVSVSATVTSSGGTPTGDVALVNSSATTGGGAAVQATTPSPSVLALTNGTAADSNYVYLPGSGTTPYTVKANYNGDGTFGPSVSNGIPVTVTPEASTLELLIQDFSATTGSGASVTSVPYGTWISVAAQPLSTVQANANTQAAYTQQATGTVSFASTSALLNKPGVQINSNGFAEIPGQTSLAYPPGAYTVSASYSGDPSFTATTAAAQTFTITKANVSILSGDGSTTGTAIVEVDPASSTYFISPGTVLPTGTVTLTSSSGATVGTGTLAVVDVISGQAAQATITLTGTPTNISYSGDANYAAGTGAFTPGGGGAGSFVLSASPQTVTIARGSSGTTTLSITPQSGFSGTVNLSCAVSGGTTSLLPSCSFAQPSITVSGSSAVTDTLTIATVSSSAALTPAVGPSDRTWYAAGGAALAGILLIGLPGRRRAWQRMLSLMLLVVALGVVGCGGGGGSSGGGTTPAGSYTVAVTAVGNGLTQTSSVSVTVK